MWGTVTETRNPSSSSLFNLVLPPLNHSSPPTFACTQTSIARPQPQSCTSLSHSIVINSRTPNLSSSLNFNFIHKLLLYMQPETKALTRSKRIKLTFGDDSCGGGELASLSSLGFRVCSRQLKLGFSLWCLELGFSFLVRLWFFSPPPSIFLLTFPFIFSN